jgi:hypothetical protein
MAVVVPAKWLPPKTMLFQRSGGPRSKPEFATLLLKRAVISIALGADFRGRLFVLRGQSILATWG